MRERLPVLVSLAGAAVLFLSIAFVFSLVIASLVVGEIDFPGGPEIADASAMVLPGVR
jgi:hypothetical protein